MKSFVVRLFAIALGLSLINMPCLPRHFGGAPIGAAQAASDTVGQGDEDELVLGKPVARGLAGGQSHRYRIRAEAGQYLHLVVEQHGIDVVVALFALDGRKLAEVDSPNGTEGPEPLAIILETAGAYLLEVGSLEKDAPAGRYEARLVEQRTASPQDRQRLAAELLTAEADRLYAEGAAPARRLARAKYEQSLALWKELGETAKQGPVANRIGEVHYFFGDAKTALDWFRQALSLMQAVNDRSGQADVLTNLSAALFRLSQNQPAIDYLNQALVLSRELGDRSGEATILGNLGTIYKSLGDLPTALDHFNRALSIDEELKNDSGSAEHLNGIGTIYHDLGEMQKALDFYERARLLMQKTGKKDGESSTLNNIGRVYNDLSENKAALETLEKARLLSLQTGNLSMQASTINNIGGVYIYMGEPEKALNQFKEAESIFKTLGDRRSQAYAIANIAGMYELLGDSEKAIGDLEQARAMLKAIGDSFSEVGILHNLGKCSYSLGRRLEALKYFEEGRALAVVKGHRRGAAFSTGEIGAVYFALGEPAKALAYFNESLPMLRALGDRVEEANTLCSIGEAYHAMNGQQKALDAFTQALDISQKIESFKGKAWALSGISAIEQARGDFSAAQSHLEAALELIEQQRARISKEGLRASYFATVQSYYNQYIALLMQRHKQEPDAGFAAQALRASERARARSLLDLLSDAHANVRQGVDTGLLGRKIAVQQRLKARQNAGAALLQGPHTAEQAAQAAREMEALQAEEKEIDQQIRDTSPRYAALTQPDPIGLAAIKTLLDPQSMLLEYSLGKQRSYLWVVTADTMQAFELPSRAEIEKAARQVYESLTARSACVDLEMAAQKSARIAAAESRYPLVATALSQMLLGPIADQLGQKRVLVVADGFLHYIPFAALPLPAARAADNRAFKPLILAHEIVNLPSASALAVLRRDAAGRKPPPKVVAVLADPVFRPDDRRLASISSSMPKTADGKAPTVGAEQAFSAACESGQIIKRLGYSRLEALAIEALVGKPLCKLMLDFDASYENAISQELSDYRIVHFSTHGLFRSDQPELTGILLSLVDSRGEPKSDSLLRLGEVYNLKLNADLVVLSACQTALGREVKGEGLMGLTRGFMYAGAARVMASLWQVNEQATAKLMKQFYQALLQENLSPAKALQKAQSAMWSSKVWHTPYYWAAFVLQGEWK